MTFSLFKLIFSGSLFCAALLYSASSAAGQTACATVKIVIEQRVTLERQAFEATLTIDNGLAVDLKDFEVNVWMRRGVGGTQYLSLRTNSGQPALQFFHEAGTDPALDLFFFRPDQAATAVTIEAGARKVYTYLLIPTGSAALIAEGTRYELGANITYTPGAGAEESLAVDPDSILVKPLPKLTLEYFLPKSIIANNPNTSVVEASVPFDLGLRVVNSGVGHAQNLKIESFQPRLEENDAGLLVEFRLLDSYVNGKLSPDGLTVNFGELLSDHAEAATWTMTSSLYGRLSEARATFTHSDALGGATTSLIDQTSVYRLIGRVDANNDGIPDFISVGDGSDGSKYNPDDFQLNLLSSSVPFLNLHASGFQNGALNSSEPYGIVANLSPYASASYSPGGNYALVVLSNVAHGIGGAPYSFTRVQDLQGGRFEIASVLRSDGVFLKRSNFRATTEIRELPDGGLDPSGFDYFIDIFDVGNVDGSLSYTVHYGDPIRTNTAPRILPLPKLFLREGDAVELIVEAVDLEGDPITLAAVDRPTDDSANFVDNGDGTALFTWTARPGLSPFVVVASDGSLSSSAATTINVLSGEDDHLGAWLERFGMGGVDLSSDLNRDGFSLLLKYVLNLNPLEKSTEGLPRVFVVEDSGQSFLVLECDVLDGVTHFQNGPITLTAIVSDEMEQGLWTELELSNDPTTAASPPAPGMTRLRWQDTQPLSGHPRFIRLKATYHTE